MSFSVPGRKCAAAFYGRGNRAVPRLPFCEMGVLRAEVGRRENVFNVRLLRISGRGKDGRVLVFGTVCCLRDVHVLFIQQSNYFVYDVRGRLL